MSPSGPRIPLPKSWPIHVRAAMLHVIALAQFATAHTRSWAANRVNARIRLQAERDRAVHHRAVHHRAVQELAWQREETRIKDARMALIRRLPERSTPPTSRHVETRGVVGVRFDALRTACALALSFRACDQVARELRTS